MLSVARDLHALLLDKSEVKVHADVVARAVAERLELLVVEAPVLHFVERTALDELVYRVGDLREVLARALGDQLLVVLEHSFGEDVLVHRPRSVEHLVPRLDDGLGIAHVVFDFVVRCLGLLELLDLLLGEVGLEERRVYVGRLRLLRGELRRGLPLPQLLGVERVPAAGHVVWALHLAEEVWDAEVHSE